jgi:protein phosphatase
MKLRYAAATDVGMKRNHNEDCFAIVEEEQLFIVCDGMGGHASGEVASKLACDAMAEFYERTRDDDITWPYKLDPRISFEENRLSVGVRLANLRVYENAVANPGRRGMGTTIVAAVAVGEKLIVGHVGDSRAYRFRQRAAQQITRDHSLLEEMKAVTPDMTEEQMRAFPHKNVITRALGMRETVQVDVQGHQMEPGDRYLLCSDGLSGMVDDSTLNARIQDGKDLPKLVTELIALANAAGGMDNVTALLIERTE